MRRTEACPPAASLDTLNLKASSMQVEEQLELSWPTQAKPKKKLQNRRKIGAGKFKKGTYAVEKNRVITNGARPRT